MLISTSTPKEVKLELTAADYIPPLDKTINMVWYLLVLDVNGLLCTTQHVLSQHKWGPFVPIVWLGNNLVCPQLIYYPFLTLCASRFDIGIWLSMTQTNLIHMVELLLGEGVEIRPVFVWGGEKCESTCVCHPLNKK
jgi:hypothetical protein